MVTTEALLEVRVVQLLWMKFTDAQNINLESSGSTTASTNRHIQAMQSGNQVNGPQVELFIWRAAMKHAEDLRQERVARHQESTALRSALALEASAFSSSAVMATEIANVRGPKTCSPSTSMAWIWQ